VESPELAAQSRRTQAGSLALSSVSQGARFFAWLSSRWTLALLPPFVAGLAFANTLANGFVFDDDWTLKNLEVWGTSWRYAPLQGRSLTYAFHALDSFLWEDWAPGFHLTNVLMHGAATAAVACLAFRVGRSVLVGVVTGLLFAVHPVHVEAVAGVSNRKDLLAMVFASLSVIVLTRTGCTAIRIGLSLLFFLLGMLAKEVAVFGLLPILMLIVLRHRRESFPRSTTRTVIAIAPFIAVAAIVASRITASLPALFSSDHLAYLTNDKIHSYAQFSSAALAALPVVLRLLLFPARLSPDYPPPEPHGLLDAGPWTGLLIIVAWTAASLYCWKRFPTVAFAMAWTAVLYFPLSGLVPLHHILVAERYLYVPSFGVCLLGGCLFERLAKQASWRGISSTALVVVLSSGFIRTVVRNRDWKDDTSLWTAAAKLGVDTWRVHHNMGKSALAKGEMLQAEQRFRLAARLGSPARYDFLLGQAALDRGAFEDAEAYLLPAVEAGKRTSEAMVLLASALRGQRRLQEALALLELPKGYEADVPFKNERAVVLEALGRSQEAIRTWESAIAADPECAVLYCNLGRALFKQGKFQEALVNLRRHEGLDPGVGQCRFLLGQAFYETGELLQAKRCFLDVSAANPRDASALNALGMVQARLGQDGEAIANWKKALQIDPGFEAARKNMEAFEALRTPPPR
jgi:tetratricopeptide (TPR) repeat protein